MDEILDRAQHGGYAVGYFEAWDTYSLDAVIEAAEETQSPAILGFGAVGVEQRWLNRWGIVELATMARGLAERATVPTAILFNEAATYEQIVQGLMHGCNACMLDSSELPYEWHLDATRRVAEMAHAAGASVEAEVGRLADARDVVLAAVTTDPDRASDFVARTGIDALAVGVGNDVFADFVRQDLSAKGLDVSAIRVSGTAPTARGRTPGVFTREEVFEFIALRDFTIETV